ncbi:MAG: hypothetical protein [Bacteriophage sp.]|nr:MAG: hypothetical protein [Bacteriophage sp.]
MGIVNVIIGLSYATSHNGNGEKRKWLRTKGEERLYEFQAAHPEAPGICFKMGITYDSLKQYLLNIGEFENWTYYEEYQAQIEENEKWHQWNRDWCQSVLENRAKKDREYRQRREE